MKVYGYCRVSTLEQNEGRQLIALQNEGIPLEHIFVDKQSGKDFKRPMYKALLKTMVEGDLLYVKSIDRLGRNYEEITNQWRIITQERNINMVVIDMPILDTRAVKGLMRTFLINIVLEVMSFVAQNERETLQQRQAEGILVAKARGVKFGRPVISRPKNYCEVVKQWEKKEILLSEALELTGLKKTTFYSLLREYRKEKQN